MTNASEVKPGSPNPLRVRSHAADPALRSLKTSLARSGEWQHVFGRLLAEERAIEGGRILDIGCGVTPPRMGPIIAGLKRAGVWDGVEPDSGVKDHPSLSTYWVGLLEDCVDQIPAESYDAAIECFVAEHVSDPRAHLASVAKILKPGAALFGYTPNWLHPFAMLSRTIETVGFKGWFVKHGPSKVNDYPAYYRMNTASRLARAARGLPFKELDVWHVPCPQWRTQFPKPLRPGPLAFEALLGTKVPVLNQMLVFRLRKAGGSPEGES